MLEFYCDHCDLHFASEPDGTGYEQAPCPACKYLAMTIEFHQEEAERHRSELKGCLRLLLPWPFSLVVSDSHKKDSKDDFT